MSITGFTQLSRFLEVRQAVAHNNTALYESSIQINNIQENIIQSLK